MKKLLLTVAIVLGVAVAKAETYMAFRTLDGSVNTISATGLDIAFVNGNMVATAGTESLTLPLSNLKSMEFTDTQAGIDVVNTNQDTRVTITRADGVELGQYDSLNAACGQLAPGAYIVKPTSGKTYKIVVK